ncbi:MAG: ATPase [Spirochaetae bacterium HGW-Spirochaetae-1]|jgi:endopeptidase Clp ATP-binding regulatory subunit ClpX|nr:MAG: ATPase [Spirochaetae bacterium HGW-Spirochaetae-1]
MTKPVFDPEKNLEELLKMDAEEVQQGPESMGGKPGEPSHASEFNFDIKPEQLEEYLNKYVIAQEEAVEVIATKVCTHFNRMKLEQKMTEEERLVGNIKSNILLIGPTGVGKTYIIKLIAKRIGVPFVKADATKFSETGYVGGDVEDLVRELVHEADGDIAKAEYGIIYIDEIDKIASSVGLHGPDVSRSGVQRNLLKLMEEADVDLKTPHDLASQVEAAMEAQKTGKVSRRKINTRNILFIVSGAFQGLDEHINKRLNRQSIGFEKIRVTMESKQDVLKMVKTEDLLQFGFESEFIGRLPVYVVLNNLDKDGLYKILKNEHSTVVLGKKLDFRSYGIKIAFSDEALKNLAKKAYEEKTGARGLLTVFEKLLIKFEKKLPSTSVTELEVDMKLIEKPDETLNQILLKEGIERFQKDFLVQHGTFLEFDEKAAGKILAIATERKKKIKDICEELFHDYFHGMRLMKLESFIITTEAVDNPQDYLNDYIKEFFKKQNG